MTNKTIPTPKEGEEKAVHHVGMHANYGTMDSVQPCLPLHKGHVLGSIKRIDNEKQQFKMLDEQPCRTGQLFGGLQQDIRRKFPWYPSDFADFFHGHFSQSLASTLLLFFANLSNIVTFGAIMEHSLEHQIACIENIICGAISGIVFGLFAGQPLSILSATGPTLIFEKILFDFCTSNQWEFLPFRFFVGTWMAFFLILLVATDASALVSLITRFTEEIFATLVSIVFIIQSFKKLIEIGEESSSFSVLFLSIGTFSIAYSFNWFNQSGHINCRIGSFCAKFGILTAILSMTLINYFAELNVPSLKMPTSIRPTLDRGWLVDFTNIQDYKVALIAAFPALFYTILVAMDQQITTVIVNRKDNKLRKGNGYHLDLLVVAMLILICSFLGLPFYVAATMLSVMHVESLKQYAGYFVPGGSAPKKFIGLSEQRLTAIFAHILIGCSVFFASFVRIVPIPVLAAIFFYMGIISLLDQQFVQRIGLLFMPTKYQANYGWLHDVPLKRIHIFTCIQLAIIATLIGMKYASSMLAMMFPIMVGAICSIIFLFENWIPPGYNLVFTVFIRIFLLERIFTKEELTAIDAEVPSFLDLIRPVQPGSNK